MRHQVDLESCMTQGCKYQGQERHLSLKYDSPRDLGRGIYAVEVFMCDCGQILDAIGTEPAETEDDSRPVNPVEIDWEEE